MRATLLAGALLVAGSSFASAATDAELLKGIVGSWGDAAACGEASLVFGADGTFVMARQGDDPSKQAGGKYQIVNGVLSGTTPDGPMPDVGIRIEEPQLFLEQDGQVVTTLTRCTP